MKWNVNKPFVFLQKQGCLFLFSSLTGCPWVGRKASRFLAVLWTRLLLVWAPWTTIVVLILLRWLLVLLGHVGEFSDEEHIELEPVGDWYSCRRTPVVGTPVEFGDEKLLIVKVGGFPVTNDNWGENVLWWSPP